MEAARPNKGYPIIDLVSLLLYFVDQSITRPFQILGGGAVDPTSSQGRGKVTLQASRWDGVSGCSHSWKMQSALVGSS